MLTEDDAQAIEGMVIEKFSRAESLMGRVVVWTDEATQTDVSSPKGRTLSEGSRVKSSAAFPRLVTLNAKERVSPGCPETWVLLVEETVHS